MRRMVLMMRPHSLIDRVSVKLCMRRGRNEECIEEDVEKVTEEGRRMV